MGPIVSIIMPAYNAEKYIAESIRSVIDQSYPHWELVVVDDGSTDNTAKIVQQFARDDSRIKYIFQENGRLGKARNTGINNSTGPLIAFLDSDDLWLEHKLERQVATLQDTEADVVFTECYVFDNDDVGNESATFATPSAKFQGADFFNLLLVRNRLAVLSVLLRRSALEKVGLFEEGKPYHGCEDYDLWLRLARNGMMFYGMPEPLVRYRRHSGAMTHAESNIIKPMILVVKKYIDLGTLSETDKRKRIRSLYRDLISALIDENKVSEARECMKQLRACDKSGLVTSIQNILIKVLPEKYNFLSKECLYRTEWHLNRIFG